MRNKVHDYEFERWDASEVDYFHRYGLNEGSTVNAGGYSGGASHRAFWNEIGRGGGCLTGDCQPGGWGFKGLR